MVGRGGNDPLAHSVVSVFNRFGLGMHTSARFVFENHKVELAEMILL